VSLRKKKAEKVTSLISESVIDMIIKKTFLLFINERKQIAEKTERKVMTKN